MKRHIYSYLIEIHPDLSNIELLRILKNPCLSPQNSYAIDAIALFMKSLTDFALNEEYKRVERLGDRLAKIESLIDWKAFRPIVGKLYENKSERGGRPNIDEVVIDGEVARAPAMAWALRSGTGEAGRGSALVQEVHRISRGYSGLFNGLVLPRTTGGRRPVRIERSGQNSNDNSIRWGSR